MMQKRFLAGIPGNQPIGRGGPATSPRLIKGRVTRFPGAARTLACCLLLGAGLALAACESGGGGGKSGSNGDLLDEQGDAVVMDLTGEIQKGPFINGSSLQIQELTGDLNPTGTSFSTQTTDNLGTFSTSIALAARYVEIIADGIYFDEILNQLSSTQLVMRSISDLSEEGQVNLNLLTSLQKDRLVELLNAGNDFLDARERAKQDVLAVFNISSAEGLAEFDKMSIVESGESNAVLLAVSAALNQVAVNRAASLGGSVPGHLADVLSSLSRDLAGDGTLDDATLVADIRQAGMDLDLAAVRANLEAKYSGEGQQIAAPDFERFVDSDGDGTLNGLEGHLLSSSLSIDEGDFTNSTSVTLTLNASSSTAAMAFVTLSEDPLFTGTAPQSYEAAKTFELSSGDGEKTIHAKFVDVYGNEQHTAKDSIVLDTTAPTAPVLANQGGRVDSNVATEAVSITTDSGDPYFSTYQAKGGQYTDWTAVSDPISFELASNDSWYDLSLRGADKAGNTGSGTTWRIFRGTWTILEQDLRAMGNAADWSETPWIAPAPPAVTLPKAYSPYLFSGGRDYFSFSTYAPLTIDAGVTIYVGSSLWVYIYNTLNINGTASEHVKITSENIANPLPGDWQQLTVSGAFYDYDARISYLDMEYSAWLTTELNAPYTVKIYDSTFTNNRRGITVDKTATVTVDHSLIDCGGNSTSIGIYAAHDISSTLYVSDSIVQNCHTGLYLTSSGRTSTVITGTNFIDNTYGSGPENVLIYNSYTHTMDDNYWGWPSGTFTLSNLSIIDQNGTGTVTVDSILTSAKSSAGPR